MPRTISVLVTPRVSFCAMAAPARATKPTSTPTPSSFLMSCSFRGCPSAIRRPSSPRVHSVDHRFVFHVHECPLQLHGRRQLLVLGGEDLLDEAELLDRLYPRELPVHPLDLAPEQVLDLLGATQGGEV